MVVRAGRRWTIRLAHVGPRLAAVHHKLRTVPVQHPVHSKRDQHHHAHHRVVSGAQDIPRARRRRRYVPQLSDIVRIQPDLDRMLLSVASRDQGQNVRQHTGPAQKNRRFVLMDHNILILYNILYRYYIQHQQWCANFYHNMFIDKL